MSFRDMQIEVDEWIEKHTIGYFEPLSIMARITEEVGELATELNDRYAGRVKKSGEDTKDIGDEVGDIMFALLCLANSHNIDLDKSWKNVMDKCYGRDKDRFEKKD